MAATKDCPSCGAIVPSAADRCKDCFYDFTETPKRNNGPLLLLGALAAVAVLGALLFWQVSSMPTAKNILVDAETRSVVFTTKYADRVETDRLPWDQIASLEYVNNGSSFEVVAVTLSGDRWTIMESENRPIAGDAEHYAQMMDKPLTKKDTTKGFHKMREGN